MAEQELARITASMPRRVLGVVAMLSLGAMLLYIALATPPESLIWRLFLLAVGGATLWLAMALWRATEAVLILTDTELREDNGAVLAEVANIHKVERGMLAMKPSNGFNILLKETRPRAWRPGLWWRMGRKVAIGGVTAGSQTRPVADMLMIKIAERDGA